MEIGKSVTDPTGNTPILELCGIESMDAPEAAVSAKLERGSPSWSVKDRLAAGMIDDAEKKRDAQAKPDDHRAGGRQHRHRALGGFDA